MEYRKEEEADRQRAKSWNIHKTERIAREEKQLLHSDDNKNYWMQ